MCTRAGPTTGYLEVANLFRLLCISSHRFGNVGEGFVYGVALRPSPTAPVRGRPLRGGDARSGAGSLASAASHIRESLLLLVSLMSAGRSRPWIPASATRARQTC